MTWETQSSVAGLVTMAQLYAQAVSLHHDALGVTHGLPSSHAQYGVSLELGLRHRCLQCREKAARIHARAQSRRVRRVK